MKSERKGEVVECQVVMMDLMAEMHFLSSLRPDSQSEDWRWWMTTVTVKCDPLTVCSEVGLTEI